MGPYAYKGNQWVGFDDASTIKMKTQFVKDMKLGGAMIWALDLDDFTNRCQCESYPLLKTINRGLGRLKDKPECQLEESYQAAAAHTYTEKCPNHGEYAPHPTDCNSYRICNGDWVIMSCPPSTVWDQTKKTCNTPEYVQGKCGTAAPADSMKPEDNNDQASNEVGDEDDLSNVVVIGEDSEGTGIYHPPPPPPPSPEDQTQVDTEFGTFESVDMSKIPDTGMKVVCYFTNWAWYRPGQGKYVPGDIDGSLCTHINYGFAVLNPNTLLMTPHDTWADMDNEFYKKVVAYKKKSGGKIKVLIAIGGWNDSEGDKYSRMVSSAQTRSAFVKHAVEFIKEHGFDGLDLDWEYPKCWQVNCNLGPASDKQNFALLMKELKEAFAPHGFLLTAAVSPSKMVIDQAYDVTAMNQYLDIINVMTYDYHGHWDKKTGHVSPLLDYEGSPYNYFNSVRTNNKNDSKFLLFNYFFKFRISHCTTSKKKEPTPKS